jgi:hypothetical protein
MSIKRAAVATTCGEFMAKLSLLYVTLPPDRIMRRRAKMRGLGWVALLFDPATA